MEENTEMEPSSLVDYDTRAAQRIFLTVAPWILFQPEKDGFCYLLKNKIPK